MSTSDYEAYKQAKHQIAQLEAEMAEFQASSRELERELEMELEESEERHKNSQHMINTLTIELDQCKSKYRLLQKEYTASQASLQKEIGTLQSAHKQANHKLREIEMTNDDMERLERITKSTLEEMEQKYHNSLEQIAMLEAELAGRDDVQIELQRTKDELRDTVEELSVANSKLETLAANSALSYNKENRLPDLVRKSSRLSFHYQGIPEEKAVQGNVALTNANVYAKPTMPRLSSSRSLRKIHGMLDQMKSLESRVANFKSSLPKPITPTKLSIPSSPPSRSRPSSRVSVRSPTDSTITELTYSPTITPSSSTSNIPLPRFRNSPSLGNISKTAAAQDSTTSHRPASRGPDDQINRAFPTIVRPITPYQTDDPIPRRSRSAAGHYSTPRNKTSFYGMLGELGSIEGSPSTITNTIDETLESEDFQKRHESKRFGGSYQGPSTGSNGSRATSMTVTRSPRSHKSVDILPFSGLSLEEPPASSTLPQDRNNTKSKANLNGFENATTTSQRSHPFYYSSMQQKKISAKDEKLPVNGQHSTAGTGEPMRPGSAFGMLHSRQPVGHGRM